MIANRRATLRRSMTVAYEPSTTASPHAAVHPHEHDQSLLGGCDPRHVDPVTRPDGSGVETTCVGAVQHGRRAAGERFNISVEFDTPLTRNAISPEPE